MGTDRRPLLAPRPFLLGSGACRARCSVNRVALVLAGGAARGAYEVGVVQHVLEEVARDLGRDVPLRHPLAAPRSARSTPAGSPPSPTSRPPRASGRVVDVWTQLDVDELVRPDVRGDPGDGRAPARPRRARAGASPRARAASSRPRGSSGSSRGASPSTASSENLQRGPPRRAHRLDDPRDERPHRGLRPAPRARPCPAGATIPRRSPAPPRITARHALASAAIPILFRAVTLDGAYHCDGGLRQNVPLSPARRLGAGRVLVVNPRYISTAPARRPPRPTTSSPGRSSCSARR